MIRNWCDKKDTRGQTHYTYNVAMSPLPIILAAGARILSRSTHVPPTEVSEMKALVGVDYKAVLANSSATKKPGHN